MATQPKSNSQTVRLPALLGYALAVLALLGAGAGICAYLVYTQPSPSRDQTPDVARDVRVFKAEKTSHRIAVTAYGTTRASEVWTAIAEVRGRTVGVDRRFEPGEVLSADTLLVQIDPTDYKLAVSRCEAEVRAKQEQLRELGQKEVNLKEIVKLQERQLELAQTEYDRQRELLAKNAVPRSALETAANAYWASMTAVQETRNGLALLPTQRDLLQASRDAAEAQLKQARRDLSKCDIRLPFAARCGSKSVELDQYVLAGERLGTFLAMEMAEVVAMVETRKIPGLFPGGPQQLKSLDINDITDVPLWKWVPIPAEVRWGWNERRWVWPGRVARLAGSLDPRTRTIPVIIEVPNPYKDIHPGIRPPLMPDVFCEVTAYGATLDDVVVIPRDALHDNRVYLLRDGKLHIASVNVLALEEDLAVIKEGETLIKEGDLVILADLYPASEGMPLRGQLVENPVKARTAVDFPADLFPEVTPPAGDAPAGTHPTDPAPSDEPAAEANS